MLRKWLWKLGFDSFVTIRPITKNLDYFTGFRISRFTGQVEGICTAWDLIIYFPLSDVEIEELFGEMK